MSCANLTCQPKAGPTAYHGRDFFSHHPDVQELYRSPVVVTTVHVPVS